MRIEDYRVMGVLGLWSGNELSMSIANPVVEYETKLRLARGEHWSAPDDLSNADVTDEPGYVPFTAPSHRRVRAEEGEVAWVVGPTFERFYDRFVGSGGRDILTLSSWQLLPNGFRFKMGFAHRFYATGAALAHESLEFYERRLQLDDVSHEDFDIVAARRVYEGAAGVDAAERSVSDAIWYKTIGDYELYKRSVLMASMLQGVERSEVLDEIQERNGFFAHEQARNLALENKRLRTQVGELDRLRQEALKAAADLPRRLPGRRPGLGGKVVVVVGGTDDLRDTVHKVKARAANEPNLLAAFSDGKSSLNSSGRGWK